MRKQIVILTFVLLIFCSASAMAGSYDLIEKLSVDQMQFTITSGSLPDISFKTASWATVPALSTDKSIIASGSVSPVEFSLDFGLFLGVSQITFTAYNGGNAVDSALIEYSNGTWTVADTFSPRPDNDLTSVPEPSLILLLGIGLGAVTLTFWRKKENSTHSSSYLSNSQKPLLLAAFAVFGQKVPLNRNAVLVIIPRLNS